MTKSHKQHRLSLASPPQPYQHIIVAVDFSPHSDKATYRAMQLTEQSGAHLTMLTVVDDMEFYSAYLEPTGYECGNPTLRSRNHCFSGSFSAHDGRGQSEQDWLRKLRLKTYKQKSVLASPLPALFPMRKPQTAIYWLWELMVVTVYHGYWVRQHTRCKTMHAVKC